jgi:predicted ATPase
MIDKVSFTNFKSLRRVDADLRRFMVIVGPNGSGKTSLLDGLYYLALATQKPLASIMNGVFTPPNLLSRGANGPMRLALTGRVAGAAASVEVAISCEDDAGSTWSAGVVQRLGEAEVRLTETEAGRAPVASPPQVEPSLAPPLPSMPLRNRIALARELGSARKLRLDSCRRAVELPGRRLGR